MCHKYHGKHTSATNGEKTSMLRIFFDDLNFERGSTHTLIEPIGQKRYFQKLGFPSSPCLLPRVHFTCESVLHDDHVEIHSSYCQVLWMSLIDDAASFITRSSNLVPLLEGLCSSNLCRFKFSVF